MKEANIMWSIENYRSAITISQLHKKPSETKQKPEVGLRKIIGNVFRSVSK